MRQIDPVASHPAGAQRHRIRHKRINVVTSNTPQHLGKASQNISLMLSAHRQQIR